MKEWPSGTLRLNVEQVEKPEHAELFIYPGALHVLKPVQVHALRYMTGNEERTVFFHCADHEDLYHLPCLFIRCNTRTWYYQHDINTIPFSWPVEDFRECIEPDFEFDVSFHGWLSSEVRRDSIESIRGLNSDIATYPDFCGYIYETSEGLRRRKEFRRSMGQSRVALCPESIPGVLPYRFFEALSAARIPCLVGSDYCLPFEDDIPYDDFIIRVPKVDASLAGAMISEFLSRTPDAELVARGHEARRYWERYLNRDRFVETMTYAVESKLKALGLWAHEVRPL